MGVLLSGVGIGGQIAGGLYRSQAAEQQGQAIADAALYNARLAQMEGAAEMARRRKAAGKQVGAYVAQMGKSGVRLEGSPLEFLVQNAEELERDALNAMVAARNTAALDRARARSAKKAGERGAGTELLMGATRAAAFGSTLIPRRR
jgi:hypothetical protein